jgi:AcrR family transcriptional regulator
MEDVARAAGIARQTIYKHFSGRDDLLIAMLVQDMRLRQTPKLTVRHPGHRRSQSVASSITERAISLVR